MRNTLALLILAAILFAWGCAQQMTPIPEPDITPLRCPACGQSLFIMDGEVGVDIDQDAAIPPPAEAKVALPAECLTPRCRLRIDD